MNPFTYLLLLFAAETGIVKAPAPRVLPAPALTACAAVTKTDVEKALGVAVGKGAAENGDASSTCDYEGGEGQVTIALQRLDAKLDLAREIESLRASVPGSAARRTEITGAPAFFLDIPQAGTQLFVIREGDFLMISVLGFGEAETASAAAREMAQAAMRRL